MKSKRIKLIFVLFLVALVAFLTNDFGLIDIEKNSIITAIAVDRDGDEYTVTAQVAVPEATDQNSENQKAIISASGKTVGYAIKRIGSLTGWFPKLSFCNLILLGNSVANDDVVKVLDYFAKTLKVQDSSLVVLAEDKAQDLLELTSPLDNISSFAIQKILLKNPALDKDICTVDLKTFVASYYSKTQSGYMPVVKIVKDSQGTEGASSSSSQSQGSGSSSQGQSDSESGKGHTIFDATTTAIFYKGIKVGELSPEQSVALNVLQNEVLETAFEVAVPSLNEVDQEKIYLVTMISSKCTDTLDVDEDGINLNIDVQVYCKISDADTVDFEQSPASDKPLPISVKNNAESLLKDSIEGVVQKMIQTKSDVLAIAEKLYRFHNKYYYQYKDNVTDNITASVKVTLTASK